MSEIKALTQYRWQDIHARFGVDEKILIGRHMPCPFCGGKDRFRYANFEGNGGFICNQCGSGDGFELLQRLTGKDFKVLAGEVRAMLGDTTAKPVENTDLSKARKKLNMLWDQAQPLTKGCATHRYLLNRGLAGISFGDLKNLRCHPGLTYWKRDKNNKPVDAGKHPAMVGLVTTTDGWPATVHVTYLDDKGNKVAFSPARKLLPSSRSWDGGAIRFQTLTDGQDLIVAEGIETALALKLQYPDCCPWAVISEGNMQKFEPPNDNSSAIYIGADNDQNFVGQAAAFSLAKKLALKKIKAVVLLPEKQGDFLDQLNANREKSA